MKTIWMSLTTALAIAACELPDECDEAGTCDRDEDGGGGFGDDEAVGGSGGESVGPLAYTLIIDDSAEENMNGTAGADICGVTATCGGVEVPRVRALLNLGDGEVCSDASPPDCATDRSDSSAALDDGAACAADSVPSDYVSLGIGGLLSVQFTTELSGCTIDVVELVGNQEEAYEVYVCDGPDASSFCANESQTLGRADRGGDVSVQVP